MSMTPATRRLLKRYRDRKKMDIQTFLTTGPRHYALQAWARRLLAINDETLRRACRKLRLPYRHLRALADRPDDESQTPN